MTAFLRRGLLALILAAGFAAAGQAQVVGPAKLSPVYFTAKCACVGITNVTGDGTAYTVLFETEVSDATAAYNPATGVYTAAVTAPHTFAFNVSLRDIGSGDGFTAAWATLVTTQGSYNLDWHNAASVQAGSSYLTVSGSMTVPMTAGDTARVQVLVAGGAKTVGVYANAAFNTFTGAVVH